MNIIKTSISGVLIIEPLIYSDNRGYFYESFNQKLFEKIVCNTKFVQDNESKSTFGVLRGLHYQLPPHAQSKLVRVVKGKVIDIAVDIRINSPTFGKYISVELTGENKRMLFIPRGFAHGYLVVSKDAIFQYKCDDYYTPHSEASIIWNDPEINIDWGINPAKVILAAKDQLAPTFADAKLFHLSETLYG